MNFIAIVFFYSISVLNGHIVCTDTSARNFRADEWCVYMCVIQITNNRTSYDLSTTFEIPFWNENERRRRHKFIFHKLKVNGEFFLSVQI